MKKMRLKIKPTLIILATLILVAGSVLVYGMYRSSHCKDIIGDGYAMGTDPEPVVIGNTCDS